MAKDYYKTLGVAHNATKEEIKKKYRELAHKFHPDKGGDEARFKEVNEAYQVLSDERRRSQYDQFGHVFDGSGGSSAGAGQSGFEWPGGFRVDFGQDGGGGFGDFDFTDIFDDFLGGGGGGRARTRQKRGKDIRVELEITFEESILGGKKEFDYSRIGRCHRCDGSGGEPGTKIKECPTCRGQGSVQKTQRTILGSFTQVATCQECRGSGKRPESLCSHCRGKGVEEITETIEVVIPRGVNNGEILKITGKGEASFYGGTPGDLYIKLHVLPHPIFRRQGDDIIMQLPLKLSQAILGDTLDINTLDGAIQLKIPEGTQSGDILKVRGKGAFSSSGYGRGALLIETKVEIPKKGSKKVRDIAQELKHEGF
ncbi:MAG: molecular chaperone DnaJ [Candidatus Sungbacteria bacterium]|nr:molecular chaperone DnaJ [Candidatus Sungbacteria bacterium]